MSEDPSDKSKIEITPRDLPQEKEAVGQPFEQLNAQPKSAAAETGKSIVRPRSLPDRDGLDELDRRDAARMKEAIRWMVEEGKTREEVAQQLKIEPLKLRPWETAYHEMVQRNLNEGEYHDTDAQLRDLPAESLDRFQENWDRMMDKVTERRLKIASFKERLLRSPATNWIFRNKRGDFDIAALAGAGLGLTLLVGGSLYLLSLRGRVAADDEKTVYVPSEFQRVVHDQKAALDAIVGFMQSKTWEDKLPYVTDSEKMRPLMEKWYRERPEQVHYDSIGLAADQPLEDSGREFLLLAVIASKKEDPSNGKPFYLFMEKTPQGYKMDWEVSAGYQSMPLDEFVKTKPTTPVELRLLLQQSEYYNFQFTPDKYLAFEATHMEMAEPLYLYAPRSDRAATQIYNNLGVKGKNSGALVKVKFPKDAKAPNQLELVEVVSETWLRKSGS